MLNLLSFIAGGLTSCWDCCRRRHGRWMSTLSKEGIRKSMTTIRVSRRKRWVRSAACSLKWRELNHPLCKNQYWDNETGTDPRRWWTKSWFVSGSAWVGFVNVLSNCLILWRRSAYSCWLKCSLSWTWLVVRSGKKRKDHHTFWLFCREQSRNIDNLQDKCSNLVHL